jgi:hypothetical protein
VILLVGEIYAGYKGFSALVGLGQQFLQVKDAATRNTLIVEFTGKLMEAQLHEAFLIERIRELEKKLMQFENWEAEKQRYELVKLDPGILIRRLKAGMENGEPPHEICANCHDAGKKSLLHNTGHSYGLTQRNSAMRSTACTTS